MASYSTNEFRGGLKLMIDGDPCSIIENEFVKLLGKKLLPFNAMTFVTTNPLQVYGQKRVRFVRVRYELVKDKKSSVGDKISYQLLRKETSDIGNVAMKINDFDYEQNKKNPVRVHVIAEKVKGLFIQYHGQRPIKKDKDTKKKQKQKKEKVSSFTWSDQDYSQGFVPQYLAVYIQLWRDDMGADYLFQTLIPVMSFPTLDEKVIMPGRKAADLPNKVGAAAGQQPEKTRQLQFKKDLPQAGELK